MKRIYLHKLEVQALKSIEIELEEINYLEETEIKNIYDTLLESVIDIYEDDNIPNEHKEILINLYRTSVFNNLI